MLHAMAPGSFRWIVLVCCCGLFAACGGKVVQQGSTGTGGSSTDGGSNNTNYPGHTLGDCHLGELPSSATTCPWLGDDGRCYPTVDDACNCVCPRDHASVCVSGFPGGKHSMVAVSCN